MINFNSKIVLCGGAGLVGMNLVHRLIQRGHTNICVIDKHKANLKILKNIFPEVSNIYGDLSQHGEWENSFKDAEILVMLQAQIGGNKLDEFKENNIDSTKNILNCYKKFGLSRLVHVSSSVVKSEADDYYSQTKNQQELLVQNSGIVCPILRPTLMFGWFDRKHLGWLSRFMKKVPIFPVPGKGNYIRQPLYVGDFCNIIISCIGNNSLNGIYNISGMEKVFYIDIITHVKKAINSNTLVIKIPYTLFYILLHTWSLFDKNPPFTVKQLQALVIKEEFEITDWPQIFNIKSTSYVNAINETFNDSTFSKVTLDF
jgi:nucleoside-diphosphate-sugar epimerase|tara:strand:+ start:1200 stop:2144 length:945 start_codon:yes stop_codon:yes gene_type:complete